MEQTPAWEIVLIAPAERSDVIVDSSKYGGKTLILYNDVPAAFPARQASYDYYTGDPDNTDFGGAPTTVPGYGPNTRTIMQVKVASAASVPSAFSLSKQVSASATERPKKLAMLCATETAAPLSAANQS